MHLPNVDARYTNLQRVGTGGFGVVYRAHDVRLDRDVAIKFLNAELAADASWRHRFRQEATAASQLNHPNITIVFDRSDDEHQSYIVMEFVDGKPLSKIIEDGVLLTDPERLLLIEQLCAGLHYAHQRQIVHRDIKPVNLMVREEQDETHVVRTLKILDFGIAKVVNANQTMTVGPFMFTPSYVSPEQILGHEADHRSDIFAVGAVAYELLVQQKAFVISSKNQFQFLEEVKRKIVDEPHQPMTAVRPDLDPELVTIIDRALAKDPDDRYRDLGEMRRKVRIVRERLEAALEAASSQATVILDPLPQQAMRRARQFLSADDPEAAITLLEEALSFTPGPSVRRLVDELLGQAREHQRLKQARDTQAARVAAAIAATAFREGNVEGAIRGLEQFEPRTLVSDQLAQLQRAALLIANASRAITAGSPADRDAALRELTAFAPAELLAPALEEFHAAAAAADERARQEKEAAALAAAQAAVVDARQRFRSGAHLDAVDALAAFDDQSRVVEQLDALREAARRIGATETILRSPDRELRASALADLAAFYDPGLIANALEALRLAERERRAAEDHDAAAGARIQAARQQFDRGDRTGALQQLEAFTPTHPTVSEELTTLRARASELERIEQQERDARALISAAYGDFTEGRQADAVAALEARRDWPLVAAALEALSRAAEILAQAERNIEHGDAAARSAALDNLERFQPADLVVGGIPGLRQRADEREAEELALAEAQGRALWEERAADAVRLAQETFAAGRRDEAVERLQRFAKPELVASTLEELQRLATLVAAVDEQVRTATPLDRRVAIEELAAAGPLALLDGAIAALRVREAELTAAEREREEAARAMQAVAEATALFDDGQHREAIALLEAYAPTTPRTTEALTALRDEHARLEAERERATLLEEAEDAEARARAAFSAGQVSEAIAILSAVRERGLVVKAFDTFRRASQEIAKARASVTQEAAPVRRAAIARIAGLADPELFRVAVAELRRIDEERTAEEARLEQARLGAEAGRSVKVARALFWRGAYEDAIQTLERFEPIALVDAALSEFRAARQEIDRAQRLVETGDDETREGALDVLRRFEPLELVAPAIERLRADHLQRQAAEEQERIELALRDRATHTAEEARRRFDAGQIEASLTLLEQFAPSHPIVTELLVELRTTMAVRDLVARADEAFASGRLVEARAAIIEARHARADDPAVEELYRRINTQRRAARLQRARHLAVRFVLPGIIVLGIVFAGYYLWPERTSLTRDQGRDISQSDRNKPQPPGGESQTAEALERFVEEIRSLTEAGELNQAAQKIADALRAVPQNPAAPDAARSVMARAAERMTAAKETAQRSGAERQSSFAEASTFESRARSQGEPQQIVEAVSNFAQAEKLFTQSIEAQSHAAPMIDAIRRSLRDQRLSEAADLIVRALAATPGDTTVPDLAREVTNRAQAALEPAKKQALDAGAQQQPAFKQASAREQGAQNLTHPQDVAQAVRSLQQARSFYLEAAGTQRRAVARTEQIQTVVTSVQALVKTGRLSDAAGQIVRALPAMGTDERLVALAQDVTHRAQQDLALAKKNATDVHAEQQSAFKDAIASERIASGLTRPEQVAQAVDAYDRAAGQYREAVRRQLPAPKPEGPKPPTKAGGGDKTGDKGDDTSSDRRGSGLDTRAEEAAIMQLLGEYGRAYERIDQDAVRRIDPSFRGFSVQQRQLLKSIRISFSDVTIRVAPDGRSATMSATQTFDYEWKRAGPPRSSGTINWSLSKGRDGWAVVR